MIICRQCTVIRGSRQQWTTRTIRPPPGLLSDSFFFCHKPFLLYFSIAQELENCPKYDFFTWVGYVVCWFLVIIYVCVWDYWVWRGLMETNTFEECFCICICIVFVFANVALHCYPHWGFVLHCFPKSVFAIVILIQIEECFCRRSRRGPRFTAVLPQASPFFFLSIISSRFLSIISI